ncbi:ComF family protein [Galbibacter mesophilus]|uniref:ComF family protein n=1 Tax=Galbibacter mesophilus TaxID=379069 RepID=UPI001A938F4E|nr:phosphoribosyltransferase family protein [Galbibacter mesophilus]MCM5662043.1 ComF family protein [Galbibacter mesophilus]
MIKAVKIINDLENLFFPTTCLGCTKIIPPHAGSICVSCRHELPLTQYINENDNPTEKILYGRVKIENGASFLRYYKKGIVQQLIHHLKYKGHEEIGIFFGKWMGKELAASKRFNDIDLVIPVPLHPKKLKSRGYNQVSKFGEEIAKALGATYSEEILINTSYSKSQTLKDRLSRNFGKKSNYIVTTETNLNEKHILIVDDVITTGATMERCIKAFSKNKNIKISIATIAITA